MATIQYQKLCRACFHVIPGSVNGCTYCGAELSVGESRKTCSVCGANVAALRCLCPHCNNEFTQPCVGCKTMIPANLLLCPICNTFQVNSEKSVLGTRRRTKRRWKGYVAACVLSACATVGILYGAGMMNDKGADCFRSLLDAIKKVGQE